MPFINHDGLICVDDEAIFSSRNKAFRLGEGLIETMLRTKGNIRLFDLHLQRLKESLNTIEFPAFSEMDLRHELVKTLSANNDPEQGIIRAQFYMNLDDDALHFIIEAIQTEIYPPDQWPEKGITVGIAQKALKCYDGIAHLKTSSRMPYNIAKREADANGWDDALLLNPQGRVVESTHSNIFVVKGNNIYTPTLSEGCINGVLRKYLLEQTVRDEFAIKEKELEINDLIDADEMFLTNAVKGIQPVKVFENKVYNGRVTKKMFDKIAVL